MIGPYVNGTALLIGSIAGGLIGPRIRRELRMHMPMVFGCTSIGISIAMVVKITSLAPVVLAVILGALFGEIIRFENILQRSVNATCTLIEKFIPASREGDQTEFTNNFVALTVLFCFSGTGIYGSLHEGMTGDPTLLIIKGILDVFTSLIFASTMGISLAVLAVPQFIIQVALYWSAVLILPFVTPAIQGDFSACGGIILLAVGLRICGIKNLPVGNMIPALVMVMPFSWRWTKYIPF